MFIYVCIYIYINGSLGDFFFFEEGSGESFEIAYECYNGGKKDLKDTRVADQFSIFSGLFKEEYLVLFFSTKLIIYIFLYI